LPCLKIHYIFYIEDYFQASNIETQFKEEYYNNRIININGRKSEWALMSLESIILSLNLIMQAYINAEYNIIMCKNIYIMFPNGNTNCIRYLDTTTTKEDNIIHNAVEQCNKEALKHQAINKLCELISISSLSTDKAIP
jgi:hypothetical protein